MSIVPIVETPTLAGWMEAGEAVVIDVRETPFFEREHIPGARSTPLARLDPEAIGVPPGSRVVFQCELGILSERAGDLAIRAGIPEVYHLGGGIGAWKRAGMRVDGTGRGPLPIQRQVQIVAGTMVALGSVLGAALSPWFLIVPGAVGCGLVLTGATGSCAMGAILAQLPFNRTAANRATS